MYQGSPLLPIFSSLSISLNRHLSAPKATFTRSIQSNIAQSPLSPTLYILPPSISFYPYDTHSFPPRVHTISILSDSLYSPTSPFLFQLFYGTLHSQLYLFVTLAQTSQTPHLQNIYFPSRSTSHTLCISPIQRRWHIYSFTQTLLRIYTLFSIAQHTFKRSPRFIFHCSAHF